MIRSNENHIDLKLKTHNAIKDKIKAGRTYEF